MAHKLTNEQADIMAAGFIQYINWKYQSNSSEVIKLIQAGCRPVITREAHKYLMETLKYRKKKITPPWEENMVINTEADLESLPDNAVED